MVNRDINPPDQHMHDDADIFSGFHFIATSDVDATEHFDFDNHHQTNHPSIDSSFVTYANDASASNDTFLYQSNIIRFMEQQVSFGNNNAPVDAGSHSFQQQMQVSFDHPQNNINNDVLIHTPYIIDENVPDNSLLQLSPSQQSTISNMSNNSVPMLLGSGEGMIDLSPNQQNDYNTHSPHVFSSNGSPCNSQTSASSYECYNHNLSDPQISDYCMPHCNGMNNDINNNNNNTNQWDPNYAFNTLHGNINQLDGINQHGNIPQYDSAFQYVNHVIHPMDNVPSSSNFSNHYYGVMSSHNNGINFGHINYPSTSTMDNSHSDFIPNTHWTLPNNGLSDSSSSETSPDNTNKTKDKGKGVAKASKERPVCDICKLKLNRKQDLKRHSRRHNGSRPFECEECHFKFARKDALDRHEKSPNGCKKHKKN